MKKTKVHNPVAKYGRLINRAEIHPDKSKYNRKTKHKGNYSDE